MVFIPNLAKMYKLLSIILKSVIESAGRQTNTCSLFNGLLRRKPKKDAILF